MLVGSTTYDLHIPFLGVIGFAEAQPEPMGDGLSPLHRARQHAAGRHRARQEGRVGHQGQGMESLPAWHDGQPQIPHRIRIRVHAAEAAVHRDFKQASWNRSESIYSDA